MQGGLDMKVISSLEYRVQHIHCMHCTCTVRTPHIHRTFSVHILYVPSMFPTIPPTTVAAPTTKPDWPIVADAYRNR
jgi:hypothetical protein